MTTTSETTAERYARIHEEHCRLRRIPSEDRTPADYATLRTTRGELDELTAVPPAGYGLPAAAQRLIDHARSHGWQGIVQWYPAPGEAGGAEPFVRVCVGRHVTPAEGAVYGGGDRWEYILTWHSRDCPPGRLRRFGQGTAVTPDRPAATSAPSIKAIATEITAHPGDGAA